jgi:uncharacterized membrane protein YfcA
MGLILLIILTFLRGGHGDMSFAKCSVGDWTSLAIFFLLMATQVVITVKLASSEQALKRKYGNINMVESDLAFDGHVLKRILILGFGGGWIAGALGLGGGVLFNPMLLHMGVPPKVSSATGMYMVSFSKVATSILYLVFGVLILDYGVFIAFWSSVGTIMGLAVANWYMRKFKRQSIIVFFLTIVLLLSAVLVPIFSGTKLYTLA